MRIKIYLLEIYNWPFNGLFKTCNIGEFFTKAVVKNQENPTAICYGIASIPLTLFIFIYLWYGPGFGGDPTPPPSAPGISAATQCYMVERFCSDLPVFTITWAFVCAEIKPVLEPFFQPLLALDMDGATWLTRQFHDPGLPDQMLEVSKEVVNRLASPQTELQRLALKSMECYFTYVDYLMTNAPSSSYDKAYGDSLLHTINDSLPEFNAELNRLAEEKSRSSSSIEQLGSVHKKVFSPVGVSTAIIMLTFCLTKVAVAILV
jgi:hypothetical protein